MKLEIKIKRFIELSKEFTSAPEEYGTPYNGKVLIGSTVDMGYINISNIIKPFEKTKLEQFREAQQELIKKAERYEEFLKLQQDLSNYYIAKDKIDE